MLCVKDRIDYKGNRENFIWVECLYLAAIVVSRVDMLMKGHQTVHFSWVQHIVCKLQINLVIKVPSKYLSKLGQIFFFIHSQPLIK